MQEFILNAEVRTETGKSYAKKIRREGKIPGIFYIHGKKSIPLILKERELHKLLTSEYALIDLKIDKKAQKCVIREVQFDPITGNLFHVDLMGVVAKEKMVATVPIILNGIPIGVKEQGGVLHQDIREIEVECLPANLPPSFELDISNLAIDDNVYVRDISIPNVTILTEGDRAIATVKVLRIAAVAEEAEPEEEVTEPETVEKEDEEKPE